MVPEGWASGRAIDFFKLQRGFDLTKAQAEPGDVPVFSSSGLTYYHSTAMVEPPGIVTGRKGSVGPVYLVDEPFWPHDTTLWVSDFKGSDARFLWYFLQDMKLERFDEASSVPTLNRNNVHRRHCVFPPLIEQRKIAEILSTWDRAIETTEALLANARTQKRALMQSLLTGKRRFPEFEGQEWREVRLGDVSKPKQWPTISQKEMQGDGYPVFGANGLIGFYHEYNHENPTTVVTCRGATCGTVSRTPAQVYITGNAMALDEVVTEIVDDGFLYHAVTWRGFDDIVSGSAQPQIIGKDIRSVKLMVPPIGEQIVITAVLSGSDQEVAALEQQIDRLRTEKKALMQQLLTGKRRVQV